MTDPKTPPAPTPPVRIQRKRTKGWKMPENSVYVGRPGKFGNPFKPKDFPDPDPNPILNALLAYESSIIYRHAEIRKELRGKNLACFCPLDQPCHADVLLEIANEK